jgi:hypothetical protein
MKSLARDGDSDPMVGGRGVSRAAGCESVGEPVRSAGGASVSAYVVMALTVGPGTDKIVLAAAGGGTGYGESFLAR